MIETEDLCVEDIIQKYLSTSPVVDSRLLSMLEQSEFELRKRNVELQAALTVVVGVNNHNHRLMAQVTRLSESTEGCDV